MIDKKEATRLASLLIEGYEGIGGYNPVTKRYHLYQGEADADGIWTIYKGHVETAAEKASGVFKNGITREQGEALYQNDLLKRIPAVMTLAGPKATTFQVAALLSQYYNCPIAWAPTSSPYRRHKAGDLTGCAYAMLMYLVSNKKKWLGLWRRRMSEALLYLTGEVMVAKESVAEAKLFARLKRELPKMVKPGNLY